MKNQNGNIVTNITLSILVVAIGGLLYTLWKRQPENSVVNNIIENHETHQHDHKKLNASVFSDGLNKPESQFTQEPDETGAGIVNTAIFNIDINGDKLSDKITRIRHESGTAHFWDEYKIEINQNGKYKNITPNGFRTTIGAECALQQLQFKFKPYFHVVKISRQWKGTWDSPSMATRTIYTLDDNKFVSAPPQQLGVVCDVTELFKE